MNRETAEKAGNLLDDIKILETDILTITENELEDCFVRFETDTNHLLDFILGSDILPLLQKKLSTAEAKLKKLK